jgi:hypothetical protein
MAVPIGKKAAEGSTSSNNLQNISPPEGSVEKGEGVRISPSNIFPLPKTKAAIRRVRWARRSEIMTCSPFKNSFLKVTKKRRSKDPSSPKDKLYDGSNVGWPSCLGKKKKNGNSFRSGCDEQYVEQGIEGDTMREMPKMVARVEFFV